MSLRPKACTLQCAQIVSSRRVCLITHLTLLMKRVLIIWRQGSCRELQASDMSLPHLGLLHSIFISWIKCSQSIATIEKCAHPQRMSHKLNYIYFLLTDKIRHFLFPDSVHVYTQNTRAFCLSWLHATGSHSTSSGGGANRSGF